MRPSTPSPTCLPNRPTRPRSPLGHVGTGPWRTPFTGRVVVFVEDKSQVRARNTPAVLAAVRDLIRTALKLAGYVNTAAARRAHAERHRVLALYGDNRGKRRGPGWSARADWEEFLDSQPENASPLYCDGVQPWPNSRFPPPEIFPEGFLSPQVELVESGNWRERREKPVRKTADEMKAMQEALDDDRAATLRSLKEISYQTEGLTQNGESRDLLHAADSLERLNEYRSQPMGWGAMDPDSWREFQLLSGDEKDTRQKIGLILKRLQHQVKDSELKNSLSRELARFESIPEKERELFRARRAWGREIIKNEKLTFRFKAANQIIDIARSGGRSQHFLPQVRSEAFKTGTPPDMERRIAQKAALAEHFGTGNCGHQSAWVFTEATRLLPGSRVTWVQHGRYHQYTIIGPPNFPESAYLDSWPIHATVADAASYGLKYTTETVSLFSRVADGRDLRAEGRNWIAPPPVPPSLPPMTFEEAMTRPPTVGTLHQIKHITRTQDGYNSDSDPETAPDHGGLTLSPEAFTASAANRFTIQDAGEVRLGSPEMSAIVASRPDTSLSRPHAPQPGPAAAGAPSPARGYGRNPSPSPSGRSR